MILVLLGTIKLQFSRPLLEIENLCKHGIIKEKIIVQSGHTKYYSEYFEVIPFMKPDWLEKLIEESSIVITHAGTGSVLGAVRKNKKTIAVARYKELNEHVDDHQLDLLDEFSKKGYIIPWYKDDKLYELLQKIESFTPNIFISQKHKIIEYLINYIQDI